MDVLLYKNNNDINNERGTKLEIIGDLQESGVNFLFVYIKINKINLNILILICSCSFIDEYWVRG